MIENHTKEIQWWTNPVHLQDGIMLFESEDMTRGRIIFSLEDLPLRISFFTQEKWKLERTSENSVHFTPPNCKQSIPIELPNSLRKLHKTQSAQDISLESDFFLLSNNESLEKGIRLMDKENGSPLIINALKDLQLHKVYITDHGNSLERISLSEVLLEDKIIQIQLPGTSRKRTNSLSRCETSFKSKPQISGAGEMKPPIDTENHEKEIIQSSL